MEMTIKDLVKTSGHDCSGDKPAKPTASQRFETSLGPIPELTLKTFALQAAPRRPGFKLIAQPYTSYTSIPGKSGTSRELHFFSEELQKDFKIQIHGLTVDEVRLLVERIEEKILA